MSKAVDKSRRTNPIAVAMSIEEALLFCIFSSVVSVE